MRRTIFVNVKGADVQAAITGMIEQLEIMQKDPQYAGFEVHHSNITVTFEAPAKKSNLIPHNGGMVQPVMVVNQTLCLVETAPALPGHQEIADLKKAYQMKCKHDNLSTGGSWADVNGERVFQVICKDCGAWVNVPGAKFPGHLSADSMKRVLEDEKADMQIPIDPIGDQLDEQDGRRPGLQ